jgi:outer membrane receptor protein involved in Fe transport
VGKGTQLFLGGFLQGDFQPIQHLDVNLAARYQEFKNSSGYDGTPGGLGNVPNSDEGSFNPRVSAKYTFIPEFDVRVAAYKAFNAPTLESLYRAYSVPAGIFYANLNLTPEKLKGAEIGFDAMVGPVTAQVTAYYNKIDNLISSETLTTAELPPGFFFGSRNINAGTAISKGIETAFQYKIMTGLSADFNYTYANSVVTSNPVDPKSVGLQVQGVPRYQMAAGLDYVAPAKWRLAADARYVDTTWGDSDNTLKLPAHLVVDLSGAYPITDKFETYLQLTNILNRRYIALNDGGSPMQFGQPLSAFLGFRAKFE